MSQLKIGHNDAIVITKSVGLSGAYTLTKEYYDQLHECYACDFLEPIFSYPQLYSYENEYAALEEHHWSGLVETGFGGIYGALFQLGYESGLGFRVDLRKIAITQPVVEVAEFFDLNPYLMHSSGCMIIATPNGEQLVDALRKRGVLATVVGYMTKEKGRIVTLDDEERFLTPARKDEIGKVLGQDTVKSMFTKNLVMKCSENE